MPSLKQLIEAKGLDSLDLDSLVHDTASKVASRINNEGLSEQLEFLEKELSEADILEELSLPRPFKVEYFEDEGDKEFMVGFVISDDTDSAEDKVTAEFPGCIIKDVWSANLSDIPPESKSFSK
jgi:hypothetical protein